MTGLLLALGVLLLAALGLPACETLSARRARRAAPWVTLAALLAAFVLSTAWPCGPVLNLPILRVLLADEWGRLMRGLLLFGMALRLAVRPPFAPETGGSAPPSEHWMLHLMGALGGALAVSTHDLALLALGVLLYALAEAGAVEQQTTLQRRLGAGALLFGVNLLYAGTATLDLNQMGRYLWEHPGPQAAMLYLGVGLTLVGLALLTRLLSLDNATRPADGVSAVLGVGALLRVCVGASGALHYVWGWLAAGLGLAMMLHGWLRARRTRAPARLTALEAAQAGLLLLALAYAPTRAGLQALLMALTAWWLAEFVATSVAQRLQDNAGGPTAYAGLLTRNSWLGTAAMVALLSLAGMPLTLGFAGRAALPWAAPDAAWLITAVLAVLLSALCAADYLQVILTIPRAPRHDAPLRVPPYVLVLLLIAALALLALGIYPQPFGAWAAAIAG